MRHKNLFLESDYIKALRYKVMERFEYDNRGQYIDEKYQGNMQGEYYDGQAVSMIWTRLAYIVWIQRCQICSTIKLDHPGVTHQLQYTFSLELQYTSLSDHFV